MTCANILLSVAAVVVFLFGAWPRFGGVATPWVLGVTAILVVILAWTGVSCSWCEKPIRR